MTDSPLLEVRDLHKHFPVGTSGVLGRPSQWLRAVDGVSFDNGLKPAQRYLETFRWTN